jgi:SAM-dependent methyltransferase
VTSLAKAYTAQYYRDNVNDATRQSASQIIPFLIEHLSPSSMLELGSGTGIWSKVALEHGVGDVVAVDGNWVKPEHLQVPRSHFLPHDLSTPLSLSRRFDLALSLEVGEHLDAADADTFVDSLTRHASVIVFGTAMPMQGGTLHRNERWPHYWLNEDVAYYYKKNTFVYVADDAKCGDLGTKLRELAAAQYQHSAEYVFIHPTKYTELATFANVSLKLMLAKAPAIIARALARKLSRNFSDDAS